MKRSEGIGILHTFWGIIFRTAKAFGNLWPGAAVQFPCRPKKIAGRGLLNFLQPVCGGMLHSGRLGSYLHQSRCDVLSEVHNCKRSLSYAGGLPTQQGGLRGHFYALFFCFHAILTSPWRLVHIVGSLWHFFGF